MTTTIDRPPPGNPPLDPDGPPPGSEPGRFSVETWRQSRAALALVGVGLAALVIGGVYLILLTFTGHFTNIDKIKAELPANSNAVTVAAPVEYRHVTVGKVGSQTQGPDGTIAVELEIYPRFLPEIPKGVQAEVEPLSIFGNQYVNLVASTPSAAGHLEAKDFVSAFGGAPSSSLQGSVTQLYNLLTAIHPADLDTALTAFATALNNQGAALGHTLSGASDYLGQAVVPNLSTAASDLKLLAPATQTLNANSPNLLGTIQNSGVTAQTINDEQTALKNLLSEGSTSIGQLAGVLATVQNSLPSLMRDSGPLLRDVTQSPTELSDTLSGLTEFASAVAAAEQHGPFVSVNTSLPIADINAGVNAALGYDNPASLDQALGGTVNPPTYSASNCPQYPGVSNPYCGVGGNPDANPLNPPAGYTVPAPLPVPGYTAGSTVSTGSARNTQSAQPTQTGHQANPTANESNQTADESNPTATMVTASSNDPYLAELNAVEAIATALNGGQAPPQPGLADMVLLPLLSSLSEP